MFAQTLLGALYRLLLGSKLTKGMSAVLLGGSTLYWVVEEVKPVEGTVLVHITEPDVEVTVGDHVFRISEREWAPIECTLRPGRYLLRMTRDDQVLYEQWFTVPRGEDVILTAYCPR
jgi:hypothetical protein